MAVEPDVIRVGMIRCDRRAWWYGAIFDRIDPLQYREYDPTQYHHFTDGSIPLIHRPAEGFRLTKVFDDDREAAERLALAFERHPERHAERSRSTKGERSRRAPVCPSLEEASEDVDLVFIANATGDGSDHLRLAAPGLKKGIATFIDRPFAASTDDAREMVRLAEKHGAPLLSCSHLSLLPHSARFKARFAEIGPLRRGYIVGRGALPTDIADGIALALHLFGGGVHSVQSSGEWPLELLHLEYNHEEAGTRVPVLLVNSRVKTERDAMYASADGYAGIIYEDRIDDFAYPEGGLAVMNAIKAMVRTGQLPMSHDAMIEHVAMAEAGAKSHVTGRLEPVR